MIEGMVELAEIEGTSVRELAIWDGTYNWETNQFCCTPCYVALGMPTRSGGGWKAGDPIRVEDLRGPASKTIGK